MDIATLNSIRTKENQEIGISNGNISMEVDDYDTFKGAGTNSTSRLYSLLKDRLFRHSLQEASLPFGCWLGRYNGCKALNQSCEKKKQPMKVEEGSIRG